MKSQTTNQSRDNANGNKRLFHAAILALLLLTLATPAHAAIALVTQGCWGSTDGNTFTTGALNTTGANFVVVVLASFQSATEPTLSDSKSNGAGAALTAQEVAASARGRLRYYTNPSVGSSHTWTATGASTFPGICAAAFSGVDTSSPFDVENGANFSAAGTWQPGSITPSADNYLLITGTGFAASAPTLVNSSFTYTATSTLDYIANTGGANFGAALSYQIQTTATARNPTWTGSATTGGVVIASFKIAAAGGAGWPQGSQQLLIR